MQLFISWVPFVMKELGCRYVRLGYAMLPVSSEPGKKLNLNFSHLLLERRSREQIIVCGLWRREHSEINMEFAIQWGISTCT